MADERILAGLRRFWTREQVETAYRAVLDAYASGVASESVIIGTSFDGQSTNAAVTLNREEMKGLLDAYEARLAELDAVDGGIAPLAGGAPSFDFRQRRVGT